MTTKVKPIHGGHLRGTTNPAGKNFGKSSRPLADAGLTPSTGRGQRRKLPNKGVTASKPGKMKV